MYLEKSVFVAALLAFMPMQSAQAQAGTADLRYVAPLPDSVVFTTIDSIANSVTGLMAEDMKVHGSFRTVAALRMAPTDSGVSVSSVIRELEGGMTTPMGDMPFKGPLMPPAEMHMDERGPAPDVAPGGMPAKGTSPTALIGGSRHFSGLVRLPGRVLQLGETWEDTVQLSIPLDSLESDMLIITRGTYAADSTLNGKVLNVLKVRSRMTMKMRGTMKGTNVTQDMTTTADMLVLWDSSLHIPVLRDATGRMQMETEMPLEGRQVIMNSKIRSITTAEL